MATVDLSWLDESPKKRRVPKPAQDNLPKRGRRGRPAVHEEFPEIVPAATSFINGNGFRAHRRRQDEVGTSGSSIPEIRDNLLSTVHGLKEAHPNLDGRTIARLMEPPNKGTRAAASYKSLIPARVPAKDNSRRKGNTSSHFYSARVGYFLQMAAKIGERALIYSADNKNKIRVGDDTLAVDRRISINRFYPTDDVPRYLDHDFPVPGYHITPSGYLELVPHTPSTTTLDSVGREQFVLPRKAQSTIFLRSPRSPCNIATHLNDISDCLDQRQPAPTPSALFLLVDGGPDFNPNHAINELYYSRFFRDQHLDALVVTCYAPGDSALNPVEHLWAPCTRALTSVYLSSSLPGEGRPPCQQGLPAAELEDKENQVFDRAMFAVKDKYWRGLRFAGRGVTVHVRPSGSPAHPYGTSYESTKEKLNKSARQLRQSDVFADYMWMVKHMDKRIGTLLFTKCDGSSCQHCSTSPSSLSPEDMTILRNFPSPRPSSEHPDHFVSFFESISSSSSVSPCEHLPTFTEKGLGRCGEDGCKYVFTSKKDKRDHRLKAHGH